MPRTYDMTLRARRAADTTERIVAATERALTTRPASEATLRSIADAAGVTQQTVLRHMGSREGCLRAVAQRVAGRIRAQRERTLPGDVAGAIATLIAHYEAEGRLVLNLLAQEEGEDPVPRAAAVEGRAYHRAWVEQNLLQAVPDADPDSARERTDALVAATDLYLWKLLRIDLGRSAADTEAVLLRLARSVLAAEGATP
ncbi:MAG: TetR/AcrR family transcriptional regulator [Trueperaceae bacterium]